MNLNLIFCVFIKYLWNLRVKSKNVLFNTVETTKKTNNFYVLFQQNTINTFKLFPKTLVMISK